MKIKLFGTLAVLSGLSVIACGDDGSGEGGSGGSTTSTSTSGSSKSTSTSTSTSSKSTSTSNSSSSGGSCALPDTTAPTTCADACSDLYDCGALTCNGSDLCAGFSGDAGEKMDFIGDANGGCIQGCMEMMALISVINPGDCASTVMTLKTLSTDFAGVCDNGFGGGGGGN